MKKVLIISPHFPPMNTADMHRVRQSLPYFEELGWQVEVICVKQSHAEAYSIDPLLMHSIPKNIKIHEVKAFPVKFTRKFGLGSLSIRAWLHIKKKGNELLKQQHFDLIYFSTTAFNVMALGPGWKKKFGVPFILDMQDPWRNDFYLDKPAVQRPPKFRIAYAIDKRLEAYTVPAADGVISVSKSYCDTFLQRYPSFKSVPWKVVTFGASMADNEIMRRYVEQSSIRFSQQKFNVVYAGRGGYDLRFALAIVFKAFAKGLAENQVLFSKLHFWFIGTSYAPAGKGQKTIAPMAINYQLGQYVTEIPDRMPFFETLFLLDKAGMLLVPGSTDTAYTASKIYPYILAQKPLLAVFYKESSVVKVLSELHFGKLITFDHVNNNDDVYVDECLQYFNRILQEGPQEQVLDMGAFAPFTAKEKTKEQVAFFNLVINQKSKMDRI